MHINEITRIPAGAGLPCPPPIYRSSVAFSAILIKKLMSIIALLSERGYFDGRVQTINQWRTRQ